jgi:hypothetical protein
MSEAFEFCIPIAGTEVPSSSDWFHETKRFPWEAALKNR